MPMSYEYSRRWLAKPEQVATLRKLEAIAQADNLLHIEADDGAPIRKHQSYINNVLRAAERLGVNTELRKVLRTWTDFRGEKFHLYVGRPRHEVPGRPVKRPLQTFEELYGSALSGTPQTSLTLDFTITDGDTWLKAANQVLSAAEHVTEISMVFDTNPLPPAEYLEQVLEGWSVVEPPPQVKLKRK